MADKLKGIAKGGWHPGKDKGNDYNYGTREERWRKNYKGLDQVVWLHIS